MSDSPLLQTSEIEVIDGNGNKKTFILSKFPAVQGLEINSLYPTSMIMSAIPKIGDYKISEALMLKLMNYVAVNINGNPLRLSTITLINNHTGDWECLVKVIWAMMEYNNSFFRNGTVSNFFADAVRQVMAKISEIYTQSSGQSSQTEKQPYTN